MTHTYVVMVRWTGNGPDDWPSVIGPYASLEAAQDAMRRLQADTDTFDSHEFSVDTMSKAI